ncbi:MAG: hypothetical protein Q4G11_01305 [Gallicola sp.]|nr:hypothetical protein [Gallicola sp.]
MKELGKLLLFFLVLVLTACGNGDKEAEKDGLENSDQKSAALYESKFWKAEIPDDWTKDEEKSEENQSRDYTVFKDAQGNPAAYIEVLLTDNPKEIRRAVLEEGQTLEDFKEKKIPGGIDIAGEYGLQKKRNFNGDQINTILFRNEGGKGNVKLDLVGEDLSEAGRKIIETFALTLKDEGHTDPPYPFEGKAYETAGGSAQIGDIKISGEFLKLGEPFATYETFNNAGAPSGDNFYLLIQDKLRIYNIAEGMKFVKEIPLEHKYEVVNSTSDGRVFVSGISGGQAFILKDLEKEADIKDGKKISMHKDGSWGVEYSVNLDNVSKISLDDSGTPTRTDLLLADDSGSQIQGSIQKLMVMDDKIAVSGSPKEGNGHLIGIYNNEGKLLLKLEGREGDVLGSITGIVETPKGYIGADANMRTFVAWDKEGTYLGNVKDEAVIGTDYPWMGSFFEAVDGSYYVIATDERQDKSCDEVLVFKIKVE